MLPDAAGNRRVMDAKVPVEAGDQEVIIVHRPHSPGMRQPERVDLGHRRTRHDSRVFDGGHRPFLAGHAL